MNCHELQLKRPSLSRKRPLFKFKQNKFLPLTQSRATHSKKNKFQIRRPGSKSPHIALSLQGEELLELCNGGGEKGLRTGAGGFISSWLVKLLLSNGYFVHGTVRNPDDLKNAHLRRLDNAENLRLFRADLLDYHSLAAAVSGCVGVFHIAGPAPLKIQNPEEEMIRSAVEGTLHVLNACSEAQVRRVVVVSSITTVAHNPSWPFDKTMNEECWSSKQFCVKSKLWYEFSKTLAEEKALQYS